MKTKNLNLLLLTIVLLLLILPTLYFVKKNHDNNLMTVLNKKVVETAAKCKNDDVCKDSKITLKFLKDNKYFDEDIVNPITKEVLKDDSYIDFDTNSFIIVD